MTDTTTLVALVATGGILLILVIAVGWVVQCRRTDARWDDSPSILEDREDVTREVSRALAPLSLEQRRYLEVLRLLRLQQDVARRDEHLPAAYRRELR